MKASAAIRRGFLLASLAAGCATVTPDTGSPGIEPEPRRATGGAPGTDHQDVRAPPPSARTPVPRDESTPALRDEARAGARVATEEPRTELLPAEPVSLDGLESPGDDAASGVGEPAATVGAAPLPAPGSPDHIAPATRDGERSPEPDIEVLPRPTLPAPPPAPAFVLAFESRDSRIEMPVEVPAPGEECDVQGRATVEGLRLSLLRYVPSASIHERIVLAPEGEEGFLALHVTLETPSQRHETWLVPGSRVFGQATFPAARIECLPRQSADQLAATRDLLERLQSPGAKILLEVKSDGRRLLFPAQEGGEIRIADPGYAVTVERIFGNFTLDPKTGSAHDVGSRPFNPAVQVRIEHRGRTRTAWLFSQLPAFSREAEDEHGIFSLVYPVTDHPHQRAEITVVDGGSGPSPVFLGRAGELHEGVVPLTGATRLAGVTIGIPERITSGRIKQTVQVDPRGRPAVLVAWQRGAREGTRWIPLGLELELRFEDAVFFAQLRPGNQASAGRSPHGVGSVAPAGHPPLRHPH